MDGKNMNDIMKLDPSTREGEYSKSFERKCPVEMKIIEMSIIRMVNQDISSKENLHMKIMVKNSNRRDQTGEFLPDIIRFELMSDSDYFFQYVYE